jgi:tetratricopeptide (TPR) repeat protein
MSVRLALVSAAFFFVLGDARVPIRGGILTGMSVPDHLRLPKGLPEIDQAIERFKNRDYDQCLSLLKSAAASHPDVFPARVMFAKLCLLANQPSMARDALEQAIDENPDRPETYLVFGRMALDDNRLTDAQLQFDKAMAMAASRIGSDPRKQEFLAAAQAGLAAVAERRKDWPTAVVALTAWLKLEPKSGQARRRLAQASFHQGQRERVYDELKQAVKDDPSLESAAILVGRLFTEEGDLKKGAEWMEYAVKLAPDDPQAHLGYAGWLLDQNQPEPAKIQAEMAARLDPNSKEIKGVCGVIAWHLKDYPTAERIFQELHLETPDNSAASNLWALSLAEQPSEAQRSRAWQVARLNAQLDPHSAEALTTLGWVAYRLGEVGPAEQTLRAAMATGKGSSETAYYLARVLADRQKIDEVQHWLKVSLNAPGRFAFRSEAQAWLDRLQKTKGQETRKTGTN